MIAAKMKPMYEAEAKLRRLATQNNNQAVTLRGEELGITGETNEIVGAMVGVGKTTVSRASKVLKDGTDELVSAVESGDISVRSAADIAKLPEPEQQQAIEEHKQGVKRKRQTKAESLPYSTSRILKHGMKHINR